MLIVAGLYGEFHRATQTDLPRIRALVARRIRPPVRSYLSGTYVVADALQQAAIRETLNAQHIALPVLAIVLILVFGSPLAASVPALMGLATVIAGTGALGLLARVTPIDATAISISAMMGLALGVDYSLLIVSRFREELAVGLEPRDAAAATMSSAGRTVLFAGSVVSCAMLVALFLAPGNVLVSAAAATLVASVVGVIGAYVATPAILSVLGHRINSWSLPKRGRGRGGISALFARATRHPHAAAGAVLLLVLVMSAPALHLSPGPATIKQLPPSYRARSDFDVIAKTGGEGWPTPFEITLVSPHGPVTTPARFAAIERWEQSLGRLPDVEAITGAGPLAPQVARLAGAVAALARTRPPVADPSQARSPALLAIAAASRSSPGFARSGYLGLAALDGTSPSARSALGYIINLDRGGTATRVTVVPKRDIRSAQTVRLYDGLTAASRELARATGMRVGVGGAGAFLTDYPRAVSAGYPGLVAAVVLVSALVLLIILRSLPLALGAVILNVATVACAFGALSFLFQGHPLLGGPGYIDAVSEALIFVVMFALSIDYEVFLVTRMRESYQRSGDLRGAIADGVLRTGGIITGAAAIMAAVFLSFATTAYAPVRQFGVGMTIAVALDATVVRLVLLPALIRLLGRRAWWLPRWLEARLPTVDVEGSSPSARRTRFVSSEGPTLSVPPVSAHS